MKNKKKRVRKIMETKQNAPLNENVEAPAEEKVEVNVKTEAETDNETPTQEEWAAALSKTVQERDSYKDSYLRAQAEFQNFKRRNASVRADAYEDGVRETISAMLPALDNLELAVKHAENDASAEALLQGVGMTLKLMTEALGKLGLSEVPALGEEFDPELHNAVMREPGGEENRITEVFQKGYKVHDKMIRYAMVKVSSGAEA